MIHSLDVEHAKAFGCHEALILQSICFWIKTNKANESHFHDGSTWMYNSVRVWQEFFPYLTRKQIRTALDNLRSYGVLKTANHNKLASDRTLWYALVDESLLGAFAIEGKAVSTSGKALPVSSTTVGSYSSPSSSRQGNILVKKNKNPRGKSDANLYTEPINQIWKNDPNPQQEKRTRRAIVEAIKDLQQSFIMDIETCERNLLAYQLKRKELWKNEDLTFCKTSYKFFEDQCYKDPSTTWGPKKLNRNSKPIHKEIDHSKPF